MAFAADEPSYDKAVRLEATREEASGGPAGVELFSRSTQHTGLLIAAVLTGASLGVLFAVVYAIVHTAGIPSPRPGSGH
ncbi:CbtA family protein [Streptomyces sp. DHE17-7]|nr:CbtA family protein [Streptomyces sp. DHE17-7]